MIWNKYKLINFFRKHLEEEIILKETVNMFQIQGNIKYVEEIDLCSYRLFEVYLKNNSVEKETYLTLHDKFIGIHLAKKSKKSGVYQNENPTQIPYEELTVIMP